MSSNHSGSKCSPFPQRSLGKGLTCHARESDDKDRELRNRVHGPSRSERSDGRRLDQPSGRREDSAVARDHAGVSDRHRGTVRSATLRRTSEPTLAFDWSPEDEEEHNVIVMGSMGRTQALKVQT